MCAVFFVRKIDTVYENINQITVVFQTINVALNKVVEKENYFVLCRYPMEDFFFCNILFQQLLLLLTLFKAVCHCLRVAPGFNKELLAQIEARLALIARQGRAFDIHLILATQRPDANILPGQIKNNMNIRICGRADTTLSTIIIGDGRAAEQIPHDAQGRFLMEDGTVFQAYYFNDDTISTW